MSEDAKTFEDWCLLYVMEFGFDDSQWRPGEITFLITMSNVLHLNTGVIETVHRIEDWYRGQRKKRNRRNKNI